MGVTTVNCKSDLGRKGATAIRTWEALIRLRRWSCLNGQCECMVIGTPWSKRRRCFCCLLLLTVARIAECCARHFPETLTRVLQLATHWRRFKVIANAQLLVRVSCRKLRYQRPRRLVNPAQMIGPKSSNHNFSAPISSQTTEIVRTLRY